MSIEQWYVLAGACVLILAMVSFLLSTFWKEAKLNRAMYDSDSPVIIVKQRDEKYHVLRKKGLFKEWRHIDYGMYCSGSSSGWGTGWYSHETLDKARREAQRFTTASPESIPVFEKDMWPYVPLNRSLGYTI